MVEVGRVYASQGRVRGFGQRRELTSDSCMLCRSEVGRGKSMNAGLSVICRCVDIVIVGWSSLLVELKVDVFPPAGLHPRPARAPAPAPLPNSRSVCMRTDQ